MNHYTAACVLLGAVILQVTVMPSAGLGSAVPLLPLLVVVSWGHVRGPRAGVGWALAAGLMCDQLSTSPIGTYTLPLVAAALAVALGSGRLADSIFMPAVLAAVATTVFVVGQMALLNLTYGFGSAHAVVDMRLPALAQAVVPAVLLNLLWLPVVYFPLRWTARRSGPPRLAWER